jgi:hypothetical protein
MVRNQRRPYDIEVDVIGQFAWNSKSGHGEIRVHRLMSYRSVRSRFIPEDYMERVRESDPPVSPL